VSQRLASIPGIGPIIATAIATTVADPKVFRSGREFAAWLGLMPRQTLNGWENPAGWDHQARQPLSASAAHQWGKRQSAAIEGDQSRSLGDRAASAAAAAGRSRGAGEQDGAHCRFIGTSIPLE
jgi:Transposase IS116/IS110/IS902 family